MLGTIEGRAIKGQEGAVSKTNTNRYALIYIKKYVVVDC